MVGAVAEARAGQELSRVLARQLDRARGAARARAAGRGRARTVARLRATGLNPAAPAATRNDVVGLVGEILAEYVLADLGAGEPFYAKWRSSGTSTSAGVDLVLKRGGTMYACESKHVHRPLRNTPATAAAARVVRALNRALEINTDAHTMNFFIELCLEERERAAECDARGDGAGRLRCLERQDALKEALKTGAYTTNAMVAFDGAHSPAPGDVRQRISPGAASRFRNPVTCFLVGVRDLYGSTEAMVERHGS